MKCVCLVSAVSVRCMSGGMEFKIGLRDSCLVFGRSFQCECVLSRRWLLGIEESVSTERWVYSLICGFTMTRIVSTLLYFTK